MSDGASGFPFEKLPVWQQVRAWIGRVYDMTKNLPESEAFNRSTAQLLNRSTVQPLNR